MFHNTTLTGFTQSDSLDERPCIRLRANHSSYARAAKLLATLRDHRFIPAAGMVYAFETATERDTALDRARREMGGQSGHPSMADPGCPVARQHAG
jgi:hypothetical protein